MKKIVLLALLLMVSCQERDPNCHCTKKAQLTHFIFIGKTMFPQYQFTKKKCDYCKMKENMKHILTVDVQKKGDVYTFTLHYNKKATVLHVNSLYEGFMGVQEIVQNGVVYESD